MSRSDTTEVAQDYVSQSFSQEMQYIRTVRPAPIADGTRHKSYFFPKDNPELVFYVEVTPRTLSIAGDSYYSAYFQLQMRDFFAADLAEVWGTDAILDVLVFSSNRVDLRTPANFDRKQPIAGTLEEMASVFHEDAFNRYGFDFNIHVSRTIGSDADKMSEANSILKFIEIMQDSSFAPSSLRLHYNKPRAGILDRVFSDTQIEILIRNWQNITSADEVLALMP